MEGKTQEEPRDSSVGVSGLKHSAVIDNNNSPDDILQDPDITLAPSDLWSGSRAETTIVCSGKTPITSNTALITPMNGF